MLLEAETNKYCPGGYEIGAISNLITRVLNFFLSALTGAYLGFFQGGCTFLADLPPHPDLDPDPHQDFELDLDPDPHQNNADGLECVGNFFAYNADFVILSDVSIRTRELPYQAGALPT